MNIQDLRLKIYEYNEEEKFYKEQYLARQSGKIHQFINHCDIDDVIKRHLLLPEVKETVPGKYLDSFFFDLTDNASIVVQKHNRYSPDLLHTHTFFELVYVYDGNCTQEISGQTIRMQSGDICIVPPGIEHKISVFDDSIIFNIMLRRDTLHSMFYVFLNTPNLLSSFFLNNIYAGRANDYILFHSGSDIFLRDSFIHMYCESLNHQKYFYQCITNTLLLDFYLIVRNYGDSVEMPYFRNRSDVQRYALLQYLQDNYRDITLAELADKFHYTSEYTSRLIKELTGKTYTEILRTIRIERSQDLLENTTMTVANIAEATGYDSPEHYIRQFKKHTGMTPSAFRKQSALRRIR
ncbi:AraC family transcriptional regulator [Agathobacter ruminis]|uniref:AraC family transcriptional regulator n=1 Tax=Agathobacter ruminis TaxID=1712665 RepID=A0A2G3E1R9_9FIRM|nr:AraC family transcriptional regulator [Agathobacter ruminis]MDC7300605.1 AraC family transcriptional regulator [Agathobacter ruminis]PHU37237.1 AraC family transcriptional regulator [Agathobacter ruminis]